MEPTKSNPSPEELVATAQEKYNTAITQNHEHLKATHTKKEFTFSTNEKRRLLEQQTIIIFADRAMDDIINLEVLPRIGTTPNNQVVTFYDLTIGKITVWTPKEKKEEIPVIEPQSSDPIPSKES